MKLEKKVWVVGRKTHHRDRFSLCQDQSTMWWFLNAHASVLEALTVAELRREDGIFHQTSREVFDGEE